MPPKVIAAKGEKKGQPKIKEKVHPPKKDLEGKAPSTLSAPDRAIYDAYYAEKARRHDITQPGVAQEAIDHYEECIERDESPSLVFTKYKYSIAHVLKPALAEEARIVQALLSGPSADVTSPHFSADEIAAIMLKFGIDEYVAPAPEPEPEPV